MGAVFVTLRVGPFFFQVLEFFVTVVSVPWKNFFETKETKCVYTCWGWAEKKTLNLKREFFRLKVLKSGNWFYT